MSFSERPGRFIKRPDDKALKDRVDTLMEEIKKLNLSNTELTHQIEKIVPATGHDENKKTLKAQLKDTISKQAKLKYERNTIQEQIKILDTSLKRKISELQSLTAKNYFKSASEIDSKIKSLDDLVGSGSLILAEERRCVKEMSSLRKLRKDFIEVEKQQNLINIDKEKMFALKQKLNAVGNKEIQKQFDETQKALDAIYNSNKRLYTKRTELIGKRNANAKAKDELYKEIRTLRANFDAEFAKFKIDAAEEQKRRDEEFKAAREAEKKFKLRKKFEFDLADASVPAFSKEINEIITLLVYFDPTYVKPSKKVEPEAMNTTLEVKVNARSVEIPADVVVLKKERQVFFEGSKSKKIKKKVPKRKNFTVNSDVISALANLSVPLPTTIDDIPSTIDVLKETLYALQSKQYEQTKINIAKAQAEIAKLEENYASEDHDTNISDS